MIEVLTRPGSPDDGEDWTEKGIEDAETFANMRPLGELCIKEVSKGTSRNLGAAGLTETVRFGQHFVLQKPVPPVFR